MVGNPIPCRGEVRENLYNDTYMVPVNMQQWKKRKVVIVGAGAVGSTFAYALAQSAVSDEIVLIDKNRELMEGQVLDLAPSPLSPCSAYSHRRNFGLCRCPDNRNNSRRKTESGGIAS
jgi:hypothetical protein